MVWRLHFTLAHTFVNDVPSRGIKRLCADATVTRILVSQILAAIIVLSSIGLDLSTSFVRALFGGK